MIPIFVGLAGANLLLLAVSFTLGIAGVYRYHLVMGIGAGLMCTLAHVAVFTYFMGTAKWLAAATDKLGADPRRFSLPASQNKRRAFPVIMIPILATMLAMFAGAGADPAAHPLWPIQVHFVLALLAIAVNLAAHLHEYRAIRRQGQLMDEALRTIGSA